MRKRVVIERLTLSGRMSNAGRVLKRLHDSGYRLIRTGPYSNKRMFPRVDPNRYLFVAEREIEHA